MIRILHPNTVWRRMIKLFYPNREWRYEAKGDELKLVSDTLIKAGSIIKYTPDEK